MNAGGLKTDVNNLQHKVCAFERILVNDRFEGALRVLKHHLSLDNFEHVLNLDNRDHRLLHFYSIQCLQVCDIKKEQSSNSGRSKA